MNQVAVVVGCKCVSNWTCHSFDAYIPRPALRREEMEMQRPCLVSLTLEHNISLFDEMQAGNNGESSKHGKVLLVHIQDWSVLLWCSQKGVWKKKNQRKIYSHYLPVNQCLLVCSGITSLSLEMIFKMFSKFCYYVILNRDDGKRKQDIFFSRKRKTLNLGKIYCIWKKLTF